MDGKIRVRYAHFFCLCSHRRINLPSASTAKGIYIWSALVADGICELYFEGAAARPQNKASTGAVLRCALASRSGSGGSVYNRRMAAEAER